MRTIATSLPLAALAVSAALFGTADLDARARGDYTQCSFNDEQ